MFLKTIETCCPYCRSREDITVTQAEFDNWLDGAIIQNAFPNLTADRRERLQTGICPKCWDEIFGDED